MLSLETSLGLETDFLDLGLENLNLGLDSREFRSCELRS